MDFKSLAAARATVKIPNKGDFPVRGLTLDDILSLLKEHKSILTELFLKVKEVEATEGADIADNLSGEALLELAPRLAYQVIATGGGFPEQVDAVSEMPVSLQLEFLDKIATETFVSEGGVKKTLGIVIEMAKGITDQVADMRA